MEDEEHGADRPFSVVAYLSAVAMGCFACGALLPLQRDAVALIALLVGFLPGLLICLPGTLLSFYLAKRYRLTGVVWYGVFGGATGLSVALLILFLRSIDPVWTCAIFATAGFAAGVTYRLVERLEDRARRKRYGDLSKRDENATR